MRPISGTHLYRALLPSPSISQYFITTQRVRTHFIAGAALWQYVSAVLPASIAIQISADRISVSWTG